VKENRALTIKMGTEPTTLKKYGGPGRYKGDNKTKVKEKPQTALEEGASQMEKIARRLGTKRKITPTSSEKNKESGCLPETPLSIIRRGRTGGNAKGWQVTETE